jgi:hypothetical protein
VIQGAGTARSTLGFCGFGQVARASVAFRHGEFVAHSHQAFCAGLVVEGHRLFLGSDLLHTPAEAPGCA